MLAGACFNLQVPSPRRTGHSTCERVQHALCGQQLSPSTHHVSARGRPLGLSPRLHAAQEAACMFMGLAETLAIVGSQVDLHSRMISEQCRQHQDGVVVPVGLRGTGLAPLWSLAIEPLAGRFKQGACHCRVGLAWVAATLVNPLPMLRVPQVTAAEQLVRCERRTAIPYAPQVS